MKILQINAVNGILSTGRTTLELAKELRKLGHKSYIAYAMGKSFGKNSYRIGGMPDRKLHALLSRITGLQAYFSIIATIRLIHYIDTIHPDIVHLSNLHSNYINLKILLKYLSIRKIATVVCLHDCWFYTGRCFHYTQNQCYQWQTGCHSCPNENNHMPRWFFDQSEKMWRDKRRYFQKLNKWAVIGVSDWITNEAKKSFLSNATIIKRIYNWVDLDVFQPSVETELRETFNVVDQFVILGVAANWGESKGIYDFIKLAELLPDKSKILLIGGLDQKYELPPEIITIPVTHDCRELARYYSMSDVLVSVSREESFGKVVAEALACGTPAVVYNSTASPELIGYNCGYIAMDNTIEGILQGVEQIRSNTKSYYSTDCRKFAIEHFDLHRCVKEYEVLYQTLLR